MMEIAYKVPFLDMMDDLKDQISGWNRTAIVSIFTDIAEDLENDAENCDTSTNEVNSIAALARSALAALSEVSSPYSCTPACPENRPICTGRCVFRGRVCYFGPCSESEFTKTARDHIEQIMAKFESLDDSDIECEVEDSPSYPFYSRYGKLNR